MIVWGLRGLESGVSMPHNTRPEIPTLKKKCKLNNTNVIRKWRVKGSRVKKGASWEVPQQSRTIAAELKDGLKKPWHQP